VNLLLDSHCLLWWLGGVPISDRADEAIADLANEVYVSAASIWELEIKSALGKLTIEGDLLGEIETAGLSLLPITAAHGQAAARLPLHHRDPFDRMLIAQAQLESCSIVSRDSTFTAYAVALISA
jgi:PIN domain nuclease of toxin-antitoxin system